MVSDRCRDGGQADAAMISLEKKEKRTERGRKDRCSTSQRKENVRNHGDKEENEMS